jgi:hypothetical protein
VITAVVLVFVAGIVLGSIVLSTSVSFIVSIGVFIIVLLSVAVALIAAFGYSIKEILVSFRREVN